MMDYALYANRSAAGTFIDMLSTVLMASDTAAAYNSYKSYGNVSNVKISSDAFSLLIFCLLVIAIISFLFVLLRQIVFYPTIQLAMVWHSPPVT